MFDWVLNTPLNTITNFFLTRFQIKVNDFFNFFSPFNFSYLYLPEVKAYLQLSRTTTMALLTFFFTIHKKTTVQESLFNKIAGLCPAASLKERTPKQVFSDEFCEILKTEHLQATASVLRKNVLPIK